VGLGPEIGKTATFHLKTFVFKKAETVRQKAGAAMSKERREVQEKGISVEYKPSKKSEKERLRIHDRATGFFGRKK